MRHQLSRNNNYTAIGPRRQAKPAPRPRRTASQRAMGHPQASHRSHSRSLSHGGLKRRWLRGWRLRLVTICLVALPLVWWLNSKAATIPTFSFALPTSTDFDNSWNFLDRGKLESWLTPLNFFPQESEPLQHSTWLHAHLLPGETLSSGLTAAGLNSEHPEHSEQLANLQKLIAPYLQNNSPRSTNHPNEPELFIQPGAEGQIEKLVLTLPSHQELSIDRHQDQFTSVIQARQVQLVPWHGQVIQSLSSTIRQAGLPEYLFADLIKIFRWQIDLVVNSQVGDELTLIYEQHHWSADQVPGKIVAAEYVQAGKVYRALRYTDQKGETLYYTPSGDNLRKTFFLTPVEFTRVSSSFGSRRHPILHKMLLHTGMDYAAPAGTPVTAVGEAKVIFIGWKGGYGKMVMLEHSEHYTTLYGHLSRYAKGLQVGQRVKAEQEIGSVGQTGLATAPHLHFEFYVDGVYQPPQQANLPVSMPIAEEYRADFLEQTKPLVAQLEALSSVKSRPPESIIAAKPFFQEVTQTKPNALTQIKMAATQSSLLQQQTLVSKK